MIIDRNTVLHIAKLARIELNDAEVELFTKQLGEILQYVEQLQSVQQPAEPFSYAGFLTAPMRPDVVLPSLPVEKALGNAPASVKQFFKVPRIIP